MAFQQLNNGRYPVSRYLNIRVQQYEVVSNHRLQYLIVTTGEAQVALILYNADGGVDGAHKLHGVVCRPVIADDEFDVWIITIIYRRQEFFEEKYYVPIQLYYSYFRLMINK